ncbi:hypothetical protein [Litorimonas sp.]|jgi:hypothetical protein|uniref:hypothetical protein n=1 Tax=Litorimonas sp. TaxID=1892381 RepID=UPI003A88C5E9
MIKSAKIAAATAALTGFASPAFADGGHMTMSGFEQIVHFLSSPVHGTLTVVALAGLGYFAFKALRNRA